jgi:hypothetical protein
VIYFIDLMINFIIMHVRLIYDLFIFTYHFYQFIYQNNHLFYFIVIFLKIMNDFKMMKLENQVL